MRPRLSAATTVAAGDTARSWAGPRGLRIGRTLRRVAAAALLGLPWALSAGANLAEKFPEGSITTKEQANEALAAAGKAAREAEVTRVDEMRQCEGKFLQNQCTRDVRRRYDQRLREIRAVELQARGVQRRLDAAERAARRAGQEASPPADTGPRKGAPAPGAMPAESDQEQRKKAEAANRAKYRERVEAHERELANRKREEAAGAAERAANVEAYEAKQRDAAAYAKRKQQEKAANEKRREARRLERENQQREDEKAGR